MARTEIRVTEPAFGEITLICGDRGINYSRVTIKQHGYRIRATVSLNYNAIDASSAAAVDAAVRRLIDESLTRAAQLRDNNRPLFSVPTDPSAR